MSDLFFCLMGPTASGKSALALALAARFPFEVISVDSALIYRQMNIGTAKPSAEELARAVHHLIDIRDPVEAYSAAQFCDDVRQIVAGIRTRGRFPLLVGGTMMYYNALQRGLSPLPPSDPQLRSEVQQEALKLGWPAMHALLQRVDPQSAARIHAHDAQRIGRALEVFRLSARPLSLFLEEFQSEQDAHFVNIALFPNDRSRLHECIKARLEQMFQAGFVAEVEDLKKQWLLHSDLPSMRAVGYRQVFAYLNGDYSYEIMKDKALAATRQLAKRQLTWLRNWDGLACFDCFQQDSAALIMAKIEKVLDNPKKRSGERS